MSEDGSRSRLYALLALMVFVWSINFVVAKSALREFAPLMLASLRYTLGALVILPVSYWTKRPIGAEHLRFSWKVAAMGIIGVAGNQLLFLLGLMRTTVAHASILIALTPVMVLLLSAWVGHEPITGAKVVGLVLALGGVMVLQGGTVFGGHGSVLGDVFVLAAGLCFAIFTVGSKEVRARYDGLTMTSIAYAASAIVLAPLTVSLLARTDFSRVTWTGWASVAYIATFPSVVAYLIFFHALRFMPSTQVSRLAYLQPFFATLLAVPVLGERVTPSLVTGGALVLAGVFWTERQA